MHDSPSSVIAESNSNEMILINIHRQCKGLTEPVEPIEMFGRIYTKAVQCDLYCQCRTEPKRIHRNGESVRQ